MVTFACKVQSYKYIGFRIIFGRGHDASKHFHYLWIVSNSSVVVSHFRLSLDSLKLKKELIKLQSEDDAQNSGLKQWLLLLPDYDGNRMISVTKP